MITPFTLEQAIALVDSILAPDCLTKIQILIFQGTWLGKSYREIAQVQGYDYGYIKDEGGKLWKQLSERCGHKINKKNIRGILQYLVQQSESATSNGNHLTQSDQKHADSKQLLGRDDEVKMLMRWLCQESCAVILILGMGGVGKTTLAQAIIKKVQPNFEYVWWRSLRNAPLLVDLLPSLLQDLSLHDDAIIPRESDALIATFVDCLGQRNCLLILDNAESILESGANMGQYRAGYENYGQLVEKMAESSQSCLMLTSREPPQGLVMRQPSQRSTQTLNLEGLDFDTAYELLTAQGAMTSESFSLQASEKLVTNYAGNPLALKIVAYTVQSLYAGNLTRFVEDETFVFGTIWELLHQQFDRLSDPEKAIMVWLCIYREWVPLAVLDQALIPKRSSRELIEVLLKLKERSLIETHPEGYSQQPVVMEFMTEWLIDQVFQEIINQQPHWFNTHALLTLDSPDYWVEAQKKLIFEPLVRRLQEQFHQPQALKHHLERLLSNLQTLLGFKQGYAAGNLFNLLRNLNFDFSNVDLSHLCLWQADLRNWPLQGMNLAHSNLAKSKIPDTFQSIFAVALSPDGHRLALGETMGRIQIWSLPDCNHVVTLEGHAQCPIWSLAFHPDQAILASGSSDRTIRIWNYHTEECLQVLAGHQGMVLDVKFILNPDEDSRDSEPRLISASEDGQTKIWDIRTSSNQSLYDPLPTQIYGVFLHPKQPQCALGQTNGSVAIIDLIQRQEIFVIPGSPGNDAALAASDKLLAVGKEDGSISLHSWTSASAIAVLKGHQGSVLGLEMADHILVSASADQTIRIWDLQTHQCRRVLRGHTSRINSITLHSLSNLLISSSEDSTVRFWDLKNGQLRKTIHGYNRRIWTVACSPNQEYVTAGYDDRAIRTWSLSTGELLSTDGDFSERVQSLCFSPDGQYRASATFNYEITVKNLVTEQQLIISQKQRYLCWAIAFSRSGQYLGSCGGDSAIHLWDIITGQKVSSFVGHQGYTMGVGFSPDDRYLFTGSVDAQVKQWNLETGDCLRTFKTRGSWVWAIAVSPTASYVAAGCANGQVWLWDYSRSNPQSICLQGHSQIILSLAFSPNNQTLISSSCDGTIRVWDIPSATCLKEIFVDQGVVASVTFNNSGDLLVSGGHNESLKLWSTETWDCLDTWLPSLLFEGMNITGIKGLSSGQKQTLVDLGATYSALRLS